MGRSSVVSHRRGERRQAAGESCRGMSRDMIREMTDEEMRVTSEEVLRETREMSPGSTRETTGAGDREAEGRGMTDTTLMSTPRLRRLGRGGGETLSNGRLMIDDGTDLSATPG